MVAPGTAWIHNFCIDLAWRIYLSLSMTPWPIVQPELPFKLINWVLLAIQNQSIAVKMQLFLVRLNLTIFALFSACFPKINVLKVVKVANDSSRYHFFYNIVNFHINFEIKVSVFIFYCQYVHGDWGSDWNTRPAVQMTTLTDFKNLRQILR